MATKPCVDTIELPKELKDYLISQREVNAKKGLDQKQSDLLTAKELQHKSENQLHNVYNQLNIDGYETKLAETITKPVSEVKPEPTIISKEQQPIDVSKEEGSGVGGDVETQYNERKKAIEDKLNQQLEDNKDRLDDIDEKGGTKTVRQKIYQEHTNEMVELEKWKMKEDLKNKKTKADNTKKDAVDDLVDFAENNLGKDDKVHPTTGGKLFELNTERLGNAVKGLRDKIANGTLRQVTKAIQTVREVLNVSFDINNRELGKKTEQKIDDIGIQDAKKRTDDELIAHVDELESVRRNNDSYASYKDTRGDTQYMMGNDNFDPYLTEAVNRGLVKIKDGKLSKSEGSGVVGDVLKGVNDKMRQTELEMEFNGNDAELSFKNNDVEIVVAKPIGADGKYSVTVSEKSDSNTGFTLNEGKTKLFDTKLEALEYAKKQKEQSLPTQEVKGSATVPIVKESGNSEPPNKPPVTKESEFQEPENEKDLKKLASNIPNEGKLREYDSRETIEKYFLESPQNNQKVLRQELMPALEHGEMLIQKARKLYGEKEFVEKTLDFIEKSNLTPDSKALMYISLENAMAREKLLNPNSVDIQKKQNLVNSKSQAFLRSNSIAINFGKLRKIAEVNFDVTKITDKFFSAKELEDKGTVERSIQADADTINKEAEVLEMRDLDIQEKIDNAVDAEITKINEALPPIKKRNAEKAIQALENFQKKIRGKAYDATIGVPLAIIDSGITVIKRAIKAGVYISDAIELGVKHIKEKYGKDWQKEGEFRADMIAGFKEEGINKEAKTAPSKVIKDALIEAGFGREVNIKNKEGIKEKKYILDWKKLTGEECSIDRMKETVNDVFEKRGYTPEEINDIQLSLNDAYNNIRASVIENSISELNRRNNKVTTPEQKSAARKLAELYNYGLFEKNPAEYDVLLGKAIGVEGITQKRFDQIHELGKALETLYASKFNGTKLNDLHLKTAIQSIDEKMRMLLHDQSQGHGSSELKLADIVRTYTDASQRMALNTLKQAAENPISGLEQNIISGIDGMLSRSSTPELRKQKRALAVNVYKDMVLAGGTNFGDVGTTFVNRGNLDVYINRMSDSQLVHAIASTAIGKVTLDASDSFFKAKLTEQKFTYNLIKVLTEKRLIDGKLVDGMKREDAINYVSEKLTGQSFKKAQETAKEIIGKVNVGGKKIVNDSQPFVDRLANDIVKAALINGKVITSDMVDAAYNAAYKSAGRNLGHVANNPISDGIQKVSGAIESKINIAKRDKEYKKAAALTYQSIFFRSILNPFVGGGTNWVVLKLEKNGLGLVSGLYNGGKTKLDLTTESGLKNAEKAMYEEARNRDSFMRGAIGGATSVLTAMLFYGIANTDEYRKWRNKNKWAARYLDIVTPEEVLVTMAKKNKELGYYVSNLLNQNDTYDKGKKVSKSVTAAGNDKSNKASALAGEVLGSSIGVPIPWRLVRDAQNIWLGANGEAPYKIPNKPTVGFWNGYLKAGMYDYIDNNPLFKDK